MCLLQRVLEPLRFWYQSGGPGSTVRWHHNDEIICYLERLEHMFPVGSNDIGEQSVRAGLEGVKLILDQEGDEKTWSPLLAAEPKSIKASCTVTHAIASLSITVP